MLYKMLQTSSDYIPTSVPANHFQDIDAGYQQVISRLSASYQQVHASSGQASLIAWSILKFKSSE